MNTRNLFSVDKILFQTSFSRCDCWELLINLMLGPLAPRVVVHVVHLAARTPLASMKAWQVLHGRASPTRPPAVRRRLMSVVPRRFEGHSLLSATISECRPSWLYPVATIAPPRMTIVACLWFGCGDFRATSLATRKLTCFPYLAGRTRRLRRASTARPLASGPSSRHQRQHL